MGTEHQPSILEEIGITPEQVLGMGASQRSSLLNFLLRWEHLEALDACLDVLIPAHPALVSLLDLRVRGLLAQQRPDEALAVIRDRILLKTSLSAQLLQARAFLTQGDVEAAHRMASSMTVQNGDSVTAWALLGEVELARGDTKAALGAYHHLNELAPQGRSYLMGMVGLYRAEGDLVTASGYAVRLLRSADSETPLAIGDLRRLRDYFGASGEPTRVADLEAELAHRYAVELAELQAALASTRRARPVAVARPGPPEKVDAAAAELLADFGEVPVSDEERAVIRDAVRRLFGFEALLAGQAETIACVLRGEDVLTILPTGGGKSLCYQLPAMMADRGTTLVISPLIALMKDQVDSLPAGIRGRATAVNSSLEGDDLRWRLDQICHGGYRLVYAAPERLRQPPFLHALRCAGVDRLVIDEAHCISAWGHDFRPDYLAIGQARQALGDPPLLAMTATAPTRVRHDILRHLGDLRVVAGDVTRPNLRLEGYHARSLDDKLRRLLSLCVAEPGSGIVYADTRVRCEELAAMLRQQGVVAGHYHAGIADRAGVQDDFMAGKIRVVVATIAFGLGIDKPDIRFVVHFTPPRSVEAYYQEAGRAGRDGLPARCVLMYSSSDWGILTRRAHQGQFTVDTLRAVYAAVKRRLGDAPNGRVAMADLERDLQSDETRARVALSLLEEVGLLRRGPDLPRAAIICLRDARPEASLPKEILAFCQAARLKPEQPLTLDLVPVARRAGLPLCDAEQQVLVWADAGILDYRPAGRDLLLEMLPPPPDGAERVKALLERYETINVQRRDEIASYARTSHCRHGHLNAYLGGRAIEQCAACDNCLESAAPAEADLPDEREQLLVTLRCALAAPWSWGRQTLIRILRGDDGGRPGARPLRDEAREQPGFGALAFHSKTAVASLLARLEGAGLLQTRSLEHGGSVVDVTPAGRAAVDNRVPLDGLLSRSSGPLPRPVPSSTDSTVADADLFERLRAWRLEQARAQGVAPYLVFHDSVLHAIALDRPVTLEALSGVKGIGARKLERYGSAVITLVRQHLGCE